MHIAAKSQVGRKWKPYMQFVCQLFFANSPLPQNAARHPQAADKYSVIASYYVFHIYPSILESVLASFIAAAEKMVAPRSAMCRDETFCIVIFV